MTGDKKGKGDRGTQGAAPFAKPAVATVRPVSPIQPLRAVRPSVEQALIQAGRLQEAGRFKDAEALLRKLTQAQPKNAQAWHMLGMVMLSSGRPDAAADLVARAIQCDASVAVFHANLTEINRQLKRLDEAIASGKRAVKADPRFALAHRNLGVAYFDRKQYDEAEACQREALKLKPDFAPAHNNLGSVLRAKGDDEGALDSYRKAVAIAPDYAEAVNNIGATLQRLGRTEEAIAALDALIAKRPNYAVAHLNRGLALLDLDLAHDALASLEAAVKLRPDYAEAHAAMARAYRSSQQPEAAEKAARKAVELAPQMAEAWVTLGTIVAGRGANDEARAAFDQALKADPGFTGARTALANMLVETGKIAEAEEVFRSVIAEAGERSVALLGLVQARKMKEGDPEIALLEEEAAKPQLARDRIAVQFALGKAYDDIGAAEKAFPHFLEGARLKRARLRYDPDHTDRYFGRVREIFSAEFIKAHEGQGFKSDLPVFVLGMPRSGTTLVEQIISSHPDVFGAGEINDMMSLARSVGFPDTIKDADAEDFSEMGRAYAAGLQARAPQAKRVTDKLPVNFMHIGLIHLILPQAKIVHVSRHPLDTCLSCFTRLFAFGNQEFTYDLAELGRYYRKYAGLMDHWRRVLPEGSFLDVRYEDLIANTEEQARRLIGYCGLGWDPRCLESHKNERKVQTASVTQVRQPVYKSSVQRWKKYGSRLQPLIEALGDVLPPEDRG